MEVSTVQSRTSESIPKIDRAFCNWSAIVEIGLLQYKRENPERFQRQVRRGIPPAFRWQVWKALTYQRSDGMQYQQLVEAENCWTSQIETGISQMSSRFDPIKSQCFRVLSAYAAHNPDVGYAHGMNFVAGFLLFVSGEEQEAFFYVCMANGQRPWVFQRLQRQSSASPTLCQHMLSNNRGNHARFEQSFL